VEVFIVKTTATDLTIIVVAIGSIKINGNLLPGIVVITTPIPFALVLLQGLEQQQLASSAFIVKDHQKHLIDFTVVTGNH
jgi:hypothetical protein